MPIRFRCEYCGQLLGIARRKAGTTTACPKCDHINVVPMDSSGAERLPEPVNAALESLRLEDWLGKAQERPRSAAPLTSSNPNVEISVAGEEPSSSVLFLEGEAAPSAPRSASDKSVWRQRGMWAGLVLSGFAAGVAVGKLLL